MALSSPRFAGNARLEKAASNKPAMGWGEKGEPVRIIQQSLIDLGYWLDISTKKFGTPDGILGNETFDRVKSFQRSKGLFPDGIIGRLTMDALDKALPGAGPVLPPLPKTPSFKNSVRIHLISLVPETTEPLSRQENNARMVLAQYGIRLVTASGQSLGLTAAERTMFEDVNVGECNLNKSGLSSELTALLNRGLAGVGANEIVVFFAKKVSNQHGSELNGCAEQNASSRPITVVSSTASPWTMGHEVVHVLLEGYTPVHSSDTGNLMYSPSSAITANPPSLDTTQLTTIRASRYCPAI
jgi:peptidoglycan hydrolase-like protein with peptidoglycan-binding domain